MTFTFSFETDDFNPSGVSNAKAVVNYKLEGDSDFRTVKFTGKSAEFVIQPGQVLVEANAEVIDDAGNKATWTYNGNKIAVMNKEEPKVVIERTSAEDSHLVQTVDGTEYFNGEVTYKATVTGMYLNENVEETWLKKLGFDATVSVNTDLVSGEDTVVLTYTVKANTVLEKKAIGFAVKDVFGRSATIKSQPDKAARKTAVTPAPSLNFIDVEGEIIYDGNTVIVDTKAPVVSECRQGLPGNQALSAGR